MLKLPIFTGNHGISSMDYWALDSRGVAKSRGLPCGIFVWEVQHITELNLQRVIV